MFPLSQLKTAYIIDPQHNSKLTVQKQNAIGVFTRKKAVTVWKACALISQVRNVPLHSFDGWSKRRESRFERRVEKGFFIISSELELDYAFSYHMEME